LTVIGDICAKPAFDSVASCGMNPAVLVLATLNRIGIAHTSFLVDAVPSIAKQYYAVAAVMVHVEGQPTAIGATPIEPELADRATTIVGVTIDLTLSSTTLSYSKVERAGERVGLVPVRMHYTATLALDADQELVGGMWTGNDAPDDVLVVGAEPELVANGKVKAAYRIPWSIVRELARASADDGPSPALVDLRTQCDGRCADL